MADLDEQRRALGRVIAEQRAELELPCAEAARRWRVASSWLARLERGEANPTFGRLVDLAIAMGTTPSDLFRRAEEIAATALSRRVQEIEASPLNPPGPPARPR